MKNTFDVRVEPVMLIKFAPASVASAFAKSVFPVPGGPKSNIPLQGWRKVKKWKENKKHGEHTRCWKKRCKSSQIIYICDFQGLFPMNLATWFMDSYIFESFMILSIMCWHATTAVTCSNDENSSEGTILITSGVDTNSNLPPPSLNKCHSGSVIVPSNTYLGTKEAGCFFPGTLFSMFSNKLAMLCRSMQ